MSDRLPVTDLFRQVSQATVGRMYVVYGEHLIEASYIRDSVIPRIKKLTEKTESGCLEWIGGCSGKGYDVGGGYASMQVKDSRRKWITVLVHRLLTVVKFGNDACAGKDVDHLCKNTRCVRPSHLEPVEHIVNVRRGKACEPGHAEKMRTAMLGPAHPHRGKKLSESHRRAISRALIGNTCRRGKKDSKETRRLKSEAQRRRREREKNE